MAHCERHPLYNPNCHDCREASLTKTRALLLDDEYEDDEHSAASILLTSDNSG
jgi:hypothetical protein